VTAEVATGFIVFHVKFILQLFWPAWMKQLGDAGVRVPDIGACGAAETVKKTSFVFVVLTIAYSSHDPIA